MKKLATLIGRLLALLSIIFLIWQLIKRYHEIPLFTWNLWTITTIILAILFFLASVLLSTYIWRIALRGGQIDLNFKKSFSIFGQAQIAKYLPGNFFQYVGQIALSKKAGIDTEPAILSLSLTTGMSIIIGTLIGLLGFIADRAAFNQVISWIKSSPISFYVTLSLTIIVAIAILAVIFSNKTRQWIITRKNYLKPLRLAGLTIIYVIIFIGFGFISKLLAESLWPTSMIALSWYQYTWGFALAWVAGFVVIGAPGGIGVREAVFIIIFGPYLGSGLAVGLAVALRLISATGDLLAFLLASMSASRVAASDLTSSKDGRDK